MEHDGCAVCIHERLRSGFDGDTSQEELQCLVGRVGDRDIWQVASVRTTRVQKPVLSPRGVEVRTRRLERRWIASPDVVHMEGVDAGRRILQFQCEEDAVRRLPQRGLADSTAL